MENVKSAQAKLREFIETRKDAILDKLSKKRQFDEEVEKDLKAALDEFKSFSSF